MFSGISNQPSLGGAAWAAQAISEMLSDDVQCRSGIVGVNDQLQIVSVRTYHHGLCDVPAFPAVIEAMQASATGVVAFEILENGELHAADSLIQRLLASCEAARATLLDILLYSPDGWNSLRQDNLL